VRRSTVQPGRGLPNVSGDAEALRDCAPRQEDYEKIEGYLKSLDDIDPLLRAVDGDRLLVGERVFHLPTDELYLQVRKPFFRRRKRAGGFVSARVSRHRLKPRFIADHAM